MPRLKREHLSNPTRLRAKCFEAPAPALARRPRPPRRRRSSPRRERRASRRRRALAHSTRADSASVGGGPPRYTAPIPPRAARARMHSRSRAPRTTRLAIGWMNSDGQWSSGRGATQEGGHPAAGPTCSSLHPAVADAPGGGGRGSAPFGAARRLEAGAAEPRSGAGTPRARDLGRARARLLRAEPSVLDQAERDQAMLEPARCAGWAAPVEVYRRRTPEARSGDGHGVLTELAQLRASSDGDVVFPHAL